jgi:uncharacterized protein YqjF (DUF2071 family)
VGIDGFNYQILEQRDHRPWPMRESPWVMTQTWHDLLFAHWRVDRSLLRANVPDALELDLYGGDAWLAVVPFRMTNVAPRGVPALPWASAFPELNVRTYVRVDDKPGVYFFSLDAGNPLAVVAARTMFNLPYHAASMDVGVEDATIHYRSRRQSDAAAEFVASYEPSGPVFRAAPQSLEYFLTERYCLYTVDVDGRPYRLDVHHSPWPLQPAEARIHANGMADVNGVTLPPDSPLLHFAKRLDIVAWLPAAV